MKTYRHSAPTDVGTFRSDMTFRCPFAVVYVGWKELPEATARRQRDHEGICYGWARDEASAKALAAKATSEGCVNVHVVRAAIRELP